MKWRLPITITLGSRGHPGDGHPEGWHRGVAHPEFAWCALPSSDGPCSPGPGQMEPGNRKVLETPWNPGIPGIWARGPGVLVVAVEGQEGPQLCTHSGAPS